MEILPTLLTYVEPESEAIVNLLQSFSNRGDKTGLVGWVVLVISIFREWEV